LENCPWSLNIFSETEGKSETGGKCIIASGGMDAPGRTDLCLLSLLFAPKAVYFTALNWPTGLLARSYMKT